MAFECPWSPWDFWEAPWAAMDILWVSVENSGLPIPGQWLASVQPADKKRLTGKLNSDSPDPPDPPDAARPPARRPPAPPPPRCRRPPCRVGIRIPAILRHQPLAAPTRQKMQATENHLSANRSTAMHEHNSDQNIILKYKVSCLGPKHHYTIWGS